MTTFDSAILFMGLPLIGAALYHMAHSPSLIRGLALLLQRLTNHTRAWALAQYVGRRAYRRAIRKLEG